MHLPTLDRNEHGFLVPKRQAWFAFGLSFLLMMFDFIDRQIVVSMFPHLKAEWSLSDWQLGALVSIVSVTIALGTLPLSLIVDRWSRVKGVVAMASVWSLATIACAFCGSYTSLLTARGFIGLGEAGYGPAGTAILSSIFPTRMRATIIGGFLAASSIGSVLGVVLGGVISARWGWQAAFGVVGVPGLVLALLFLFVKDYKAPALGGGHTGKATPLLSIAKELFRARSGVAAYFGGAFQLVAVSAIFSWLPSFFNRVYGLPSDKAGLSAAGIILCAAIGTVFWAVLADRLATRDKRWRLWLPALCCLATLVSLSSAFAIVSIGPQQIALITLGGFLMTATVGTTAAVAVDVVHPAVRTTAGAMVATVYNLFGLGIGPLITGALSDHFGLQTAMAIIPVASALACVVLLAGARSYPREYAAVAHVRLEQEDAALAPALA